MNDDLKALIEKQRAKIDVVKESSVEVVIGDEKRVVTVGRVRPDAWDALMADNPPRRGVEADAMVGYNVKGVTVAYPLISVGGESLDAEGWAELYSVLDSVWRNNIGTLIWGVNVQETLKELQALGKAPAGQSSPSPAN